MPNVARRVIFVNRSIVSLVHEGCAVKRDACHGKLGSRQRAQEPGRRRNSLIKSLGGSYRDEQMKAHVDFIMRIQGVIAVIDRVS
jgi:hypothetical protein